MFASLMRGKTNKKLPRELPRMHLSVRCDAHVLSLLVSPPFRLSFSLSFLSFSFLRANRCTRRVPTSCPSPVVYPLPRLAFNSASPRPPPLSTPYFSPATPPNPVTLLPRSLSFSPFLSLSPSPPVNQQPTPPHPPESWCILHALVASMHSRLLRHAAQAQLEFLDVVDTFFIGTKGTVVRVRCVSNAIGLLRETVSADQRERTSGYRK